MTMEAELTERQVTSLPFGITKVRAKGEYKNGGWGVVRKYAFPFGVDVYLGCIRENSALDEHMMRVGPVKLNIGTIDGKANFRDTSLKIERDKVFKMGTSVGLRNAVYVRVNKHT